MSDWTDGLQEALAAPFPEGDVSWVIVATQRKDKPDQMDLWAPYVDADVIIGRLDKVCGSGAWSSTLTVAGSRAMLCSLTVAGVTRTGVGECEKEKFPQPLKAAATDAFKRAASLFGVGRYLRKVRSEWRAPKAGRPRAGQPARQNQGQETRPPDRASASSGGTSEATKPATSEPQSEAATRPKRTPGQEAFGKVLSDHQITPEEACGLLNAYAGKTTKERLGNLITEIKARKQCDAEGAWKEAAERLAEAFFAGLSEQPEEREVDAIS